MSKVSAKQLERTYRLGSDHVVHALAGVDVEIASGSFTVVLGRSGSGKSTLLNVLGGLDRPTAGRVEVDGVDLGGLSANALAAYRGERVGFVFQSFHLQPRFPAWENVALPLVFGGAPRGERRRRALELLERVGLSARADHRPAELSGGEQQRVAIARSLIRSPRLLLGDEPTGNLDTDTSRQILDLLAEANTRGTTLVLVTHDAALARAHADRIIEMADGRVVEDTARPGGTP